MKKSILTFSLCLFIYHLQAQYRPIYKDTSTHFFLTMEVFDAAYGGVLLEFTNDTTIGDHTYKKTYFSNSLPQLEGFFREDTTEGKAWFYDPREENERLIMDLNLQVGDTFNIASQYFYYSTFEDFAIVDSVTEWNGRKVITFGGRFGGGYISEQLKFIEGVGPNASVIYLISEPIFNLAVLTCEKYENENLVFEYKPGLHNCLSGGGSTDRLDNAGDFSVFPNPFSDQITIESKNGDSNFEFNLFDVKGQQLIRAQNSDDPTISVPNIGPGVYFYSINSGKTIQTGKLIKR